MLRIATLVTRESCRRCCHDASPSARVVLSGPWRPLGEIVAPTSTPCNAVRGHAPRRHTIPDIDVVCRLGTSRPAPPWPACSAWFCFSGPASCGSRRLGRAAGDADPALRSVGSDRQRSTAMTSLSLCRASLVSARRPRRASWPPGPSNEADRPKVVATTVQFTALTTAVAGDLISSRASPGGVTPTSTRPGQRPRSDRGRETDPAARDRSRRLAGPHAEGQEAGGRRDGDARR